MVRLGSRWRPLARHFYRAQRARHWPVAIPLYTALMQAAADVTGVCAAGPLHAWRSPTPERRIPLACHSFFCNGILLTLPALSSLLPAKCASWTHAAPSSVLRWRDCCLTRHLSLLLTSQAGRFCP